MNDSSYQHRIAFGCWINDMRNTALPLQRWPAPHCDEATVEGITRTLDVVSDAGFGYLDAFGQYATGSYPLDIVSAFEDPEGNANLSRIDRAAADRGIQMALSLGLMTWGYDQIIREDPETRGLDNAGNPHEFAMCGAKEKSWAYVEKIIDTNLAQRDYGAVHLESADLGYCGCPECGGQYGSVGYNARINARAAEYIKSKRPDILVYVCPIAWIPFGLDAAGEQQQKFTPEEVEAVVELSKHIDIFMDQGHHGAYLPWADIPRMQCPVGTSGGLWAYHGSHLDRLSYIMSYPKRAAEKLKEFHAHGVRACLYYQGPMVNPAVEVNSAVAGRVMQDVTRDSREILEEVIELYYRPANAGVRSRIAQVFLNMEEAYYGQWVAERFKEAWHLEMPGEYCLGHLQGDWPDGATYLAEPFLDPAGRATYGAGVRAAIAELTDLQGQADDNGRIANFIRALGVTHQLLVTWMKAKGEAVG